MKLNPTLQTINVTVNKRHLGCGWGFPGEHSGKESACQCRRHKRCWFNPWVRKISWRRKWQPTSVFLPGESHGQRNLVGYNPWSCKESGTTEATQQACIRAQRQASGYLQFLAVSYMPCSSWFSIIILTTTNSAILNPQSTLIFSRILMAIGYFFCATIVKELYIPQLPSQLSW